MTDGFSWVVLPTWRGRYPLRYLLVPAVVLVLAGLLPVVFSSDSPRWMGAARWVVFGMFVGAAVGLVVSGRREVVVTAGRFQRHRVLQDVTSNQILSLETRQRWWGRHVRVVPIGSRPVAIPIVSWSFWPEPDFDEQLRGLRLALGMPADPPPDVG